MRGAARIAAALLAAPLAAQAPPPDRQAQVDAAIFDVCPRVFEGTLSLADPAAAASIGFTATAPRDTPGGPIPRAERGTGAERIVVAGQHTATAQRQCSVWFGGPDDARLLKGVEKAAKAAGYRKGPVARLGDGTGLYKLVRSGAAPQTLVVILADGGGELDPGPATTVIYMDEKD